MKGNLADYEEARVAEMGYRPELRREFGFFHAFALSFADTSLIVAFYGVFAIALGAAGPTFFWGLLVVLVGQFLVSLILSEVASAWPLEGGVYQWTRKQTGPTAGWFAAWTYWWTMVFAGTTCAYAAASFLLPGIGIGDASKLTIILLAIVIVLVGLAINSIAQAILKVAMTGNIADPVIQTVTYHFGGGFEKPVLILIAMGFLGSMVALHTAGSRTLYAMGRDRAIPAGAFFTRLSATRKLPVVALASIAVVSIVILLVNIGASQVFTTLLSVAVVGFFMSYGFVIVSQLVLQFRGKHVAGPFTLGPLSMIVTVVATIWTVFELVNVWWPRSPDLPWYQNYGVLVVTLILAVLGVIAYAIAPRHEISSAPPTIHKEPAPVTGGSTD